MPLGLLIVSLLAASLSSLQVDLAAIAKDADGRLGAAVLVVETGETVSVHGDGHFPMQSVYKAPIGMAVLHEVDEGHLQLDAPIHVAPSDLVPRAMHSPLREKNPHGDVDVPLRELLRLAVEESDGTASDVVLRVLGGKPKAQAYLSSLGIEDLRIATTEAEMGRDARVQYQSWATPREAVRWLAALQQGKGLTPASRELLLGWMRTTKTFPTRLKGRLPAGADVAHKTGSSGSRNGFTPATNDIGILTLPDGRHLAVAVFLSDSKADEAARDATIAKVARAAWDAATAKTR
ncbi:MAG TPA: class A beta-lactamase [Vicinamibacteria bacterium]|nr:class A beta-lactamase [Vicinamibacteria bacterium]